jgi:hypothetical protein
MFKIEPRRELADIKGGEVGGLGVGGRRSLAAEQRGEPDAAELDGRSIEGGNTEPAAQDRRVIAGPCRARFQRRELDLDDVARIGRSGDPRSNARGSNRQVERPASSKCRTGRSEKQRKSENVEAHERQNDRLPGVRKSGRSGNEFREPFQRRSSSPAA